MAQRKRCARALACGVAMHRKLRDAELESVEPASDILFLGQCLRQRLGAFAAGGNRARGGAVRRSISGLGVRSEASALERICPSTTTRYSDKISARFARIPIASLVTTFAVFKVKCSDRHF